ncbi:enoyl-CoA hydratase/isomerase family protein [Xenophilus azovorans]|uniref:enoyl-CoA hydratase/isomerase family protein n=1 Tax=Xenophilus azovorans TaxID=151755 RepID=UPI0005700B56|nr:enoyl-CoA hydratase/isomerase family protein [Xenophilus azovorans]
MDLFETYANRFEHIRMRREDGILELQLHTDGGPLRWGFKPHMELSKAFRAIAQDQGNHVMILTGVGDEFTGPRASEGVEKGFHAMRPEAWEHLHADGMELMDSLLAIQALVIGAVNGPAVRHCELALLSDIVIASDNAEFQDSAHFPDGLTPGDGINVITPLVMGLTRARYFHLTGQIIKAQEAKSLGLVNEVTTREELMPRAWALARQLKKQKPMVLRHTRILNTHELRRRMLEMVGYGLALEGLDIADSHERAQKEGGH